MDGKYKSIKHHLKTLIKPEFVEKLNQIISDTHVIVTQAYQFVNLYCLHCYETGQSLPIINIPFLRYLFCLITIRADQRGATSKNDYSTLTSFYHNHYKYTVVDKRSCYKLSFILSYERETMVSNINTNVQEHFLQHLFKYVNYYFDVAGQKEKFKKIEDPDERQFLFDQL